MILYWECFASKEATRYAKQYARVTLEVIIMISHYFRVVVASIMMFLVCQKINANNYFNICIQYYHGRQVRLPILHFFCYALCSTPHELVPSGGCKTFWNPKVNYEPTRVCNNMGKCHSRWVITKLTVDCKHPPSTLLQINYHESHYLLL